MRLQPSSYNRTDPLFPYTTLFRSGADGGRDQPRQPAHPVGAAPGDAGAPRLGGRGVPSAAAALPRVGDAEPAGAGGHVRSEEHTSELQSLMRISYAVFCLKNKNKHKYVNLIDNSN